MPLSSHQITALSSQVNDAKSPKEIVTLLAKFKQEHFANNTIKHLDTSNLTNTNNISYFLDQFIKKADEVTNNDLLPSYKQLVVRTNGNNSLLDYIDSIAYLSDSDLQNSKDDSTLVRTNAESNCSRVKSSLQTALVASQTVQSSAQKAKAPVQTQESLLGQVKQNCMKGFINAYVTDPKIQNVSTEGLTLSPILKGGIDTLITKHFGKKDLTKMPQGVDLEMLAKTVGQTLYTNSTGTECTDKKITANVNFEAVRNALNKGQFFNSIPDIKQSLVQKTSSAFKTIAGQKPGTLLYSGNIAETVRNLRENNDSKSTSRSH